MENPGRLEFFFLKFSKLLWKACQTFFFALLSFLLAAETFLNSDHETARPFLMGAKAIGKTIKPTSTRMEGDCMIGLIGFCGSGFCGDAEQMVGRLRFWWWRCGGGSETIMNKTRNFKDLDATTSTRHDDADTNSTMQKLKRTDAKAQIVSRKRSNPNIFGFFVDCRKNRCNLH